MLTRVKFKLGWASFKAFNRFDSPLSTAVAFPRVSQGEGEYFYDYPNQSGACQQRIGLPETRRVIPGRKKPVLRAGLDVCRYRKCQSAYVGAKALNSGLLLGRVLSAKTGYESGMKIRRVAGPYFPKTELAGVAPGSCVWNSFSQPHLAAQNVPGGLWLSREGRSMPWRVGAKD